MDGASTDELTNSQYLSARLISIFMHRIEVLVATAQAYRTDESPHEGKKLADLIKTLEDVTAEAGADRLVTMLPLLIELVADSLVELIAENNDRLLKALAK